MTFSILILIVMVGILGWAHLSQRAFESYLGAARENIRDLERPSFRLPLGLTRQRNLQSSKSNQEIHKQKRS